MRWEPAKKTVSPMVVPDREEGASIPGDVRTALSSSFCVINCSSLFNMVTGCVWGIEPLHGLCGSAPFKFKGTECLPSTVPIHRSPEKYDGMAELGQEKVKADLTGPLPQLFSYILLKLPTSRKDVDFFFLLSSWSLGLTLPTSLTDKAMMDLQVAILGVTLPSSAIV